MRLVTVEPAVAPVDCFAAYAANAFSPLGRIVCELACAVSDFERAAGEAIAARMSG